MPAQIRLREPNENRKNDKDRSSVKKNIEEDVVRFTKRGPVL